ncbi:hypothetical protein I7J22_02280 [Neisseria meningitidis]|uniref:hypothetical protein n=1 Tax=Neisseria meningitidis TaxID=487 RepID=UPI0018648275|nr:hypothetical protein [Neisseria meningitidis]MBH2056323.1 hypothetical protein [Neisseria meningitidis]MBH2061451.1 hypothetical protein [Neisseria meningitidis]MBH2080545.1 hypothetical protein [Neisseria meningitidis]MBH2162138.1 hypothetical protein [Neisseria meningitidis]MBH2281365.1 hypothetical protein [Neisseria meningitidis]
MAEQTTKRYPDIRGWLKETYPQYYPLSRRAESGEWVSDFYKEDRPFILAGMRCAAMRWEVQKFCDGLGMGRGVQTFGFIPDDVSEADLNRVFEAARDLCKIPFPPDSRNPNTGFRLFSPQIPPNFTQISP